jgi:CDP-glycerol glycerophosphotransferase
MTDPNNRGPGPARNAGLKQARGDYVWFVDADDRLPPGAVEAVLDTLAATHPDVLLVDHAEVQDDQVVHRRCRERLGPVSTPLRLADHPLALRLEPSPCTKVVRRALLDEAGLRFPPGRYEDAYFSRMLLIAARSIDILDRTCYLYRQDTPGSTTSSTADWHFDIFEQYARVFGHLDRAEPDHVDLRAELFRAMVDHYLVVLGHPTRLPRARRREFFARVVADVGRFRPPKGYPRPGGVAGLKHRLVALGAYRPYAVLRWAYRLRRASGSRSPRTR